MKIAVLLTSLIPFSLFAAAPATFTNTAGGNWSVTTNWDTGVPANAQDQVATIAEPSVNGAPTIITQNISPTVTLGTLHLRNINNTFGYTINSSPATLPITFSVSSGSALIDVDPGNTTGGTFINCPIVLASNLVINNPIAPDLTFGGVISGAFTVTCQANNTFLNAVNTFTGGMVMTGGSVAIGVANAIPAAHGLTINGGTLFLQNFPQTVASLNGPAIVGGVDLQTATLTVNSSGSDFFSGIISGFPVGNGTLTMAGAGILTLGTPVAPNNYGLTNVTGGTLRIAGNNVLPTAGDLIIAGGTFSLNNFNQSVRNLSGSAGAITLGTGQLTITPNANNNFAAVISGGGSVVYNGVAQTWTLSAAQTYTGGTTINSGTIILGIANGLPLGGAVTLTGGGTINLNNFSQTVGTFNSSAGTTVNNLGAGQQLTVVPTANANFAGVINGAGGVAFQGPFAWIIQTAQPYTGGTTINGGTLQMGVANGLAPTGPVTVNNPGILALNNFPLAIASLSGNGAVDITGNTLTLNTTTTTTFSGPIVGAGHLTVAGTGTQILTGTNSYSTGTTVNVGATLQGNTTSLQGAIANNGTLFFNQGFSSTFAGPLSGTGLLQVGGGGIFTAAGTPVQQNVTVLSGSLNVAPGAILTATTAVTINSGGTLGGTGVVVTPNVFNSGTINPGDVTPDGTLTITGSVAFQPGSTFVADLTSTTSDHLIVNGQVTIDPSSQIIISAARGNYEEQTIYPIITSTVPVVGQFQDFEQTNPFLEADIFYNRLLGGSVEIDLKIRNLADVIQGGNAGAIAKCITQTNMRNDEDLENLVSSIIFMTVDEARKILDEMQPSQLRALTVAEQNNTLFAQQTLNWRMAQFDRSTCEKEISKSFPWNFWVSLAGNWTEQRPADHNVGYTAPAIGFTTGFDGKIADNLFLGLAVEYGHVWFDWKEDRGSTTINRVSAGPYLSYVGRFGYVNTSILGSFAHFRTWRNIPTFHRTAESSHDGETLMPHLDAGVVFHPAKGVSLTPFAALDLLYGWEDTYQETGAESLNFTIASSSSTLLRSEVGLKISKCAVRSHTKWVHDLKASWVRESRFHGKDLTATFRQFPCTFTVEGLYPCRNLLDVGMGLTFIFKQDGLAATLRYEGQFGEGVTVQSCIAQLLTRF